MVREVMERPMTNSADEVQQLFDDPDFAGITIQRYREHGDERMEDGEPQFMPRQRGRKEMAGWVERHITSLPVSSYKITPVYARCVLHDLASDMTEGAKQ